MPDVYILQPISSILKNFNNKVKLNGKLRELSYYVPTVAASPVVFKSNYFHIGTKHIQFLDQELGGIKLLKGIYLKDTLL